MVLSFLAFKAERGAGWIIRTSSCLEVLWFTWVDSWSDPSPCRQIRRKIKLPYFTYMTISSIFTKITIAQILWSALLEWTKGLQVSLRRCPLHLAQIFQNGTQDRFLLFGSQCIFCFLPHSNPTLSHKQAWWLQGPEQPKLMIKIEMPETVETEADWMIYSNLQDKLLLSPELKFRLVVSNHLECSASLVLTPQNRHKTHIKYISGLMSYVL